MPHLGHSNEPQQKQFVPALKLKVRVADLFRNWLYQAFYLIICFGVALILALA